VRMGGAPAPSIHLEEAVGDEHGGHKPGHKHPRVRSLARGERRVPGTGT
jgi:hypothetical protein